MKKQFLLVCFLGLSAVSFAQIKNPVQWTYSAKKLNATTYEVHLTATIESGWHIYSQTTPPGGPVPTFIAFAKNPLTTIDGTTKEVGNLEQRQEELFGVDVKQYSNKLDFVQKVRLKAAAKTSITGSIEFMSCNDKECLPPRTEKFSVALN
jgi:thiol:disulfide interchange protein DsbD